MRKDEHASSLASTASSLHNEHFAGKHGYMLQGFRNAGLPSLVNVNT